MIYIIVEVTAHPQSSSDGERSQDYLLILQEQLCYSIIVATVAESMQAMLHAKKTMTCQFGSAPAGPVIFIVVAFHICIHTVQGKPSSTVDVVFMTEDNNSPDG